MALSIADVYWSSAANTYVAPPSPERTLVGAFPYLNTADEDGSYAQLWEIDDVYNYANARFAASSVSTPAAVQVKVQAWAEDVEFFRVLLFGPSFEIYAAWENVAYSTPGTWVDWTLSTDSPENDFYPDFDGAAVAAAAAAGELRVGFGNGSRYRLSFVEVSIGGPIPLRWRNRNDGLSGGPRQARGVSSQQMSNRHRGYL